LQVYGDISKKHKSSFSTSFVCEFVSRIDVVIEEKSRRALLKNSVHTGRKSDSLAGESIQNTPEPQHGQITTSRDESNQYHSERKNPEEGCGRLRS
jgi:hypothetical protein